MNTLPQNTATNKPASVCEIIRLHGEITAAARTSLDKAIRIGELLAEQKARLDHGHWLPWLKSNVPFTDRTARNYIRCFENRDRLKLESVSDLTNAYQMLAEPDRPSDLLHDLPDAKTLAADISEAGQKRFETFHTESLLACERGMERLQAAGNIGEVLQIKRDADRLLQYWQEVTLWCEKSLGLCLLEIEAGKKEAA